MMAPQSPPWETYRAYPRRFISTSHAAAMRGRIREWTDQVQQLEDRSGPAMGHDQRQRIRLGRPYVDEVDVHSVDGRQELRQGIEPGLGPAPIVGGLPVFHECPQPMGWDALRAVGHRLTVRPTGCRKPPAQVIQCRFRDVRLEGTEPIR